MCIYNFKMFMLLWKLEIVPSDILVNFKYSSVRPIVCDVITLLVFHLKNPLLLRYCVFICVCVHLVHTVSSFEDTCV